MSSTHAGVSPHWWQRLIPDTLFGRLMAVLVIGLVGALSLSTWISLAEREDVLRRTAGLQPAERLADLVELLDPLAHTERDRLVRVLDSTWLRVTLTANPTELPPPEADYLMQHPGAVAAQERYIGALRAALGNDRQLRVQLLPTGQGRPERPMRHHAPEPQDDSRANTASKPWHEPRASAEDGMARDDRGTQRRRRPMSDLKFMAQVQLSDGQWLRLDSGMPHDPDPPQRMLASLSVLVLAVLGLSWWAVRRITWPLRQLADAADALGRDLNQPPLPESGAQEVRSAQHAFNTMQARLRRMLEERTHLLAAVSHDLKTPLTRMRLRAELLDDDTLRDTLTRDLDEMTQMVNDTLDFLRGMNQAKDLRPVDLNALLEGLQADHQAMGREVTLTGDAGAPWRGDATRLRRCLGNLIDNAVLYGQRADLSVQDKGAHIEIRVRDAGPGIPDASLDQVFEPFFRLEASRNRHTGGSGLGLSIARHIAQASGGSLVLRNHPDGGLEALLTLPRGH